MPVNRPVRSARTSKSKVTASFPGWGGAVPTWPRPVTRPAGGGGDPVQLTAKVVVAVAPAGTLTVRGFAPPTLQFAATPVKAIE